MKTTSFIPGDHFGQFIEHQVSSGRYGSASEVIRAALRLLEDETRHRNTVIEALIEGEKSGVSKRSPEDIRQAVKEEIRNNGVI